MNLFLHGLFREPALFPSLRNRGYFHRIGSSLCGVSLSRVSHGDARPRVYKKTRIWKLQNGYETRQSSLLYVFVRLFGLNRAQNTTVVYSVLRN